MTDILAERQKTHGDFYDVAMVAQELKDVLRRGKNWKMLDDAQREAVFAELPDRLRNMTRRDVRGRRATATRP